MPVYIEPWAGPDDQMAELGNAQWSVTRLFELTKDLEVMTIPIEHLNIYHKYDSLTLRQMVTHMQGVLDADLKCPIILDEDGEILDGRHRLMLALLEGKKSIKAVRFEQNPRPCKLLKTDN